MELKTRSRLPDAAPPSEARRRATVVIADTGTVARVIVIETELPLSLGSCFSHGGTQWRIVDRRPDSRVLVAERERN
jgi:hypothetical protein